MQSGEMQRRKIVKPNVTSLHPSSVLHWKTTMLKILVETNGRLHLFVICSVFVLTALFYLNTDHTSLTFTKIPRKLSYSSTNSVSSVSAQIPNHDTIWTNEVPAFFIYDLFYRGGAASTLEQECEQSLTAEFCNSLFSAPQRTLQKSNATLFLVPIFNSAIEERESITNAVARLKQDRYFLKLGGSDFLFACYTKHCKSGQEDLLYSLGKANRAFWLARNGTSEWTCANRIVGLEDVSPAGVATVLQLSHALTEAGQHVQGRNRWVCQGRLKWGLESTRVYAYRVLRGISFYSEKDKVVYCGVPKVGSSVAVLMMRRMNGMSDWKQSNTLQIRDFRSERKWRYGRKKQVLRIFDDTNWVKGMLVRDPVTRLLSGYKSKIEDLKEYAKLPGKWEGDEPPTFEQTVRMIKEAKEAGDFDRMDRHFRPQSALCGVRDLPYDFVGRYEEREEDIKDFLKSLELWQSIGATGWGVNGTTAIYEKDEQIVRQDKPKPVTHADDKSVMQQYYTRDLIKLVMELYDEDYQRFGFSKDIDVYL